MASCGASSCNLPANFPRPNDRTNGGPIAINAGRLGRQARRPRFFSLRLSRVSDVVQNPSTITMRELAFFALVLYALYRGAFAADHIYTVLARRDVSQYCRYFTAMRCLRLHLRVVFWIVFGWAVDVGVWMLVAAVGVFFAEEAVARIRAKLTSRT